MAGSTEPREKAVPKYFLKTPKSPEKGNFRAKLMLGAVFAVIGLFLYRMNAAMDPWQRDFSLQCLAFLVPIGSLLLIGYAFLERWSDKQSAQQYQKDLEERYEPKPSDQQMDEWLHNDIQRIKTDALRKLDLLPKQSASSGSEPSQGSRSVDRSLLPTVRDTQEGSPGSSVGDLIIVDPHSILQRDPGEIEAITEGNARPPQSPQNVLKYLVVKGPERDADLAVGLDGVVRYSKYRILLMYLTDYHMASYQCSLDMAKGADTITSESTQEYHYADVVSVATQTDSSEFPVMIDGKKTVLPSYQKFAMAVSSGDRTEMAVSFPQLKDQLKDVIQANIKPATEIDDAIAVIRSRLREKKGGLKV